MTLPTDSIKSATMPLNLPSTKNNLQAKQGAVDMLRSRSMQPLRSPKLAQATLHPGGLHSQGLLSRATDFESGSVLTLYPGSLHSEGPLARATDFGSGSVLTLCSGGLHSGALHSGGLLTRPYKKEQDPKLFR